MLELTPTADTRKYSRAFAGDTLNAAIYAKRRLPTLRTEYVSAIGEDTVSRDMQNNWRGEGIESTFTLRIPGYQPGIYLIDTGEDGERSFTYWRKGSAATQLTRSLEAHLSAITAEAFDLIYFSGITLAILPEPDKQHFLNAIQAIRKQGSKIVFDPNFRPKMWNNLQHAQSWIQAAYQLCDIALPGLEDHAELFQHRDPQTIMHFLRELQIGEGVIKCGRDGVFAYGVNATLHHPFQPAPLQVDTTAAGDSFAGSYLGSRLAGSDIGTAVAAAANVARLVVQYQGAILGRHVYDDHFCW